MSLRASSGSVGPRLIAGFAKERFLRFDYQSDLSFRDLRSLSGCAARAGMSRPDALNPGPVSAAIRADTRSASLLADSYEVRDQQGRRRSKVGREQAAAGLASGAYRPIGRTVIKYLMVIRSDGGGDIKSSDANLTTINERGAVAGYHRRSAAFGDLAVAISPQK
jgi:hypothetical protein